MRDLVTQQQLAADDYLAAQAIVVSSRGEKKKDQMSLNMQKVSINNFGNLTLTRICELQKDDKVKMDAVKQEDTEAFGANLDSAFADALEEITSKHMEQVQEAGKAKETLKQMVAQVEASLNDDEFKHIKTLMETARKEYNGPFCFVQIVKTKDGKGKRS